MKKYNRSQEKENSLISINKYTNLGSDKDEKESFSQTHSCGKSNGRKSQKRDDRKNRSSNGQRPNHASRGSTPDWSPEKQHQRDHARQTTCESGLSYKDRRKHRTRCKAEGRKVKRLNNYIQPDTEEE